MAQKLALAFTRINNFHFIRKPATYVKELESAIDSAEKRDRKRKEERDRPSNWSPKLAISVRSASTEEENIRRDSYFLDYSRNYPDSI